MVERILEELHGEEPISGQEADSGVLRDKTNDAAIEREAVKEAAKKTRRRKKTTASFVTSCFQDLYRLTDEVLGRGAYASVVTCVNILTDMEFAVKVIDKIPGHPRARVFREVETFHHCHGHPNIIQLLEMFEDDTHYYLVFEKIVGGELLSRIQEKDKFTEREAAEIIRDLATALKFLHSKGIAHRDLKPENILCVSTESLSPVKLCDLDLGSGIRFSSTGPMSNPRLHSPVGSAEFMAPEVVETFLASSHAEASYDKQCDLWSLGVILYILLCGYQPFWGFCKGDNCCADCIDCRVALFDNILEGRIVFDREGWDGVSEQAKDLVSRLLIKDPERRLTAEEVLEHPWVAGLSAEGSNALETPRIINRNSSAKELSSLAESAMCLNRVVVQQLSICQAAAPVGTADNQLSPVQASALLSRRQTQTV
ncbi:MAP kinase-interacting serine/threonine-protein kinase 2 isoform X2 [Cimex lectularius]|uniref:Protein kinase domain-containing protein n=1 Tax=Cimex lectularius TaxID=79782 RepID=A0A8I6RC08_CIMLE|nr:MAP kinase-interacting serine/threonine-protein kinase 2 isoform X2 [Cimex lectularius]